MPTYEINLEGNFTRRLNTADQSVNRFERSVGGSLKSMAGFAVAGALIGKVLVNSVRRMAEFEEVGSNLSAITGLMGEDLDFLKRKAIEMGGSTTKSSVDTLKAFKLIASAKPELLNNASALAATTKEAIALSEASGLELPAAAEALTTSLNQFSLSADQSSRVINVLAAGSKFAAAEIPELALSLKEFGGIADSLNITLEQSAAAVETLSTKGLKGARAGIQLKNVFLKLGASEDRLNPKVVGLATALDNLAEIQDDTTALTKKFGTENVLAAQILIKQRDRVDELTEAMTGTNIAYEQQSINTNNLNSDIKGLSSAWERFIFNMNEGEGKITNALRSATQYATDFINKLDQINKTDKEINLANSIKEMDKFKESFTGTETDIEIADKIGAELLRLDKLSKYYAKEQDRLGGRDKVNNAFSGIGGFVRGNLDRQNEIERLNTKESLARLTTYRKALGKLDVSAFKTSLSSEIMPPALEGKKIDGMSELQDQATRITSAAPKVFNINIAKFVENFTVSTETLSEGATEVRETFVNMWIKMLADVQAVGGR